MPATPTASRPSAARAKVSCHTFRPTAPSTTKAMGRYSIAATSTTRRTRIPSAVRQDNGWSVNNSRKDRVVIYVGRAEVCGRCPLKTRCTTSAQRFLTRHLHDDALQRMQQRTTPQIMRLRRSTVEHPFATLKYRIFGHPRFLLRGKDGAQTEIILATIAYNLKRMMNVLGGRKFAAALCF